MRPASRGPQSASSEEDQADFTAELSALLEPSSHVELVQETILAMAPAARR